MKVRGLRISTFSPLILPSARRPENFSLKGEKPWREAIASAAMKPMLWRLLRYLSPLLPRPAIRCIADAPQGKGIGGGRNRPAMSAYFLSLAGAAGAAPLASLPPAARQQERPHCRPQARRQQRRHRQQREPRLFRLQRGRRGDGGDRQIVLMRAHLGALGQGDRRDMDRVADVLAGQIDNDRLGDRVRPGCSTPPCDARC